MNPETCAQYRSGASTGPFPWCLKASTSERPKVMDMKSAENQTIRYSARTEDR